VTAIVDARELFAVYPGEDGGVAALQGLTLRVEEGEICVVLGPSGSGKTTLLRVLAGFERPSVGSVVVDGLDLSRAAATRLDRYRRETLGYTDQHYWQALADELTAAEIVALPLGLAGSPRADRDRRASELLERVGLLDRAAAHPAELSGGEQQRIALCAALACRPRLLLADEPTGELDAATAAEVYELLAELVSEQGATAVVVSHDTASIGIADRVVHIRDGRVSEQSDRHGESVVVGNGGWLRVPEEVLRAAGIGGRARAVARDGHVELHPTAGPGEEEAKPAESLAGSAGALVEVRGVTRRYGTETALGEFSGSFAPGRLTVVTGPSGSGKSTLMSLLAGLDVPDEGEVVVGAVTVSALDREGRAAFRREHMAIVGQAPILPGFLSARENVELGLGLRGIEGPDAHRRAVETLTAVGLAQHADRRTGALSAGQRERVALARAFATQPAIVLADEPTARLDAAATVVVGTLLRDLAHDAGLTVVCATHDPLLIELADDELRLGQSVEELRRGIGRIGTADSSTASGDPRQSRGV
jgi:ABC-type lipoprotein export system ATPase subunit